MSPKAKKEQPNEGEFHTNLSSTRAAYPADLQSDVTLSTYTSFLSQLIPNPFQIVTCNNRQET